MVSKIGCINFSMVEDLYKLLVMLVSLFKYRIINTTLLNTALLHAGQQFDLDLDSTRDMGCH